MLEQNDTAGRTNKTMRKELVPVILMDYEQAKYEISRIEYHYNSGIYCSVSHASR